MLIVVKEDLILNIDNIESISIDYNSNYRTITIRFVSGNIQQFNFSYRKDAVALFKNIQKQIKQQQQLPQIKKYTLKDFLEKIYLFICNLFKNF